MEERRGIGDKRRRSKDLENVRLQKKKKEAAREEMNKEKLHNKPRVKALVKKKKKKICFLGSGIVSHRGECRFVLAGEFIHCHCVRCE